MSDAIKEAMKECGLEELLNFGELDFDSSMELNIGSSSQTTLSQLPHALNFTSVNTFTSHQVSQTIPNQAPIIIRLGTLPSQPQIMAPQLHPNQTQTRLAQAGGVILRGNVRPQSLPFVCQSVVTSSISQHSLPSQNGRIIKLIPKVTQSSGAPGPIRALVNNGLTNNMPLVLNPSPIITQINAQPTNIRHITRQTLPSNTKPVVQLPMPNQNGVLRLSVPAVARHNATRPPVLHQNISFSAGGTALPNNLHGNIPFRVVTRPNVHHLAQRPITVLNQNVASLNASRFATPIVPSSTVVLTQMSKNTPSPPSQLNNFTGNQMATSQYIEMAKASLLNVTASSTANISNTTSVQIKTSKPTDKSVDFASSLPNSPDMKLVTLNNPVTSVDKQSINSSEEKKTMAQVVDTDSGDIWAALSELAAFDGLKEEDLGKAEPTSSVKDETFTIKNEALNTITSSSILESNTLQSNVGTMNRIQSVQKVVIGEKVMYPLRSEFLGGPRIPIQNVSLINNNPRTYTPQIRPNGHLMNLISGGLIMKEDEAEEELGHAETFSEYMPTKLKLGCKHPDPVVESASLSSVEAPDVNYNTALPKCCWQEGLLSAVQMESIVYACQKHTTFLPNGDRAGFLIGDGAGVGKGRIISGIIYENYLQGRKRALWLSVSNDLKVDAERDLFDIGATNIKVYSLNKFKYEKISSKENGKVKSGVVFATYSSLVGQSKIHNKYKTRLQQLVKWLSKDPDSVIVFDECHKAKNLFSSSNKKATKTSEKVLELQNKLKKSRVIYASATGATEPRNMGYMIRLGLWGPGTPFNTFADFVQAVEKRGVGAMEMIAMEMKQRGTYIARQLSFKGVSFHVEDVDLSDSFVEMYNKSVQWWVEAREKFQQASGLVQLNTSDTKKMWGQFWSSHQRFFKYLCISSKIEHCVRLCNKAIKQGKTVVIGLQSTGESRMKDIVEKESDELDDFVSTAKEVLKNLVEKYFPCSRSLVTDSRASSPKIFNSNNKRLLLSDSYGHKHKKLKKESESSDASDSSDNEDDDNAGNENASSDESDYNPFARNSDEDSPDEKTPEKKKSKKKRKASSSEDESEEYFEKLCDSIVLKASSTDTEVVEEALIIKRKLLKLVERLGDDLPPNALDDLINQLGGPVRVAEMTGRKGRLVSGDGGMVRYEKRNDSDASLEAINLSEKQKFMDGNKLIAIISEAASSGISLQADRRAINQRRRVHITLELPWSADRAIQQFGRTHRSNQVSAPEYVFLISKLAGERRFASTVAKRLECLGALTHGDRRAAEARDLSQFNIDNKFGHSALDAVLKSVIGVDKPLVPPCSDESETEAFFRKVRPSLVGVGLLSKTSASFIIEKDSCNITKFLNRILGMEVEIQNSLFGYFTNTLGKIIMDAKKEGKWDLGILDIGSSGELVEEMNRQKFKIKVSEIHTSVVLHYISVDRGFNWEAAHKLAEKHNGADDGIYKYKGAVVLERPLYILALSKKDQKNEKWFEIYKPSNGKQPNLLSHKDLKKSYEKIFIPTEDVIMYWQKQFDQSLEVCSHRYEKGYCLKTSCEVGKRKRYYNVLSGSVLSVWTNMERVLSKSQSSKDGRLQVIRLRTSSNKRIVGVLINPTIMDTLMQTLNSGSANNPLPSNAATSRAHSSSSTPDLSHSSANSWGQANSCDWR